MRLAHIQATFMKPTVPTITLLLKTHIRIRHGFTYIKKNQQLLIIESVTTSFFIPVHATRFTFDCENINCCRMSGVSIYLYLLLGFFYFSFFFLQLLKVRDRMNVTMSSRETTMLFGLYLLHIF